MNQEDRWERLASIKPAELVDATVELHWAAQIVAATAQTFAEPREDDSHRALSWDPGLQAFVGTPLAGAYPFRASVRPSDMTLQLLDRAGEALGSLPLAGQTLDEAYSWLSVGLATYMGGAPRALDRPEFDIPSHPVGSGKPFTQGLLEERDTLSALYDAAHAILSELVEQRDDASSVLCWPHHFDIATLLTLQDSAEVKKTVGVGMAPLGGGYDSWYWYATPWPYPDPANLPELDSPGAWHTEGWVGIVLTGEQIESVPAGEREALVTSFISSAIAAAATAMVD